MRREQIQLAALLLLAVDIAKNALRTEASRAQFLRWFELRRMRVDDSSPASVQAAVDDMTDRILAAMPQKMN